MESRDEVQVVLRTSTSTSPDCSAVKRSLAVSGTNLTLLASLKIAAAMARQTSTSRPVHLPCASGRPKPASWPLAPQLSMPRSLTVFSVCAEAPCAANTTASASARILTIRFISGAPLGATRCTVTPLARTGQTFSRRRAVVSRRKNHGPGLVLSNPSVSRITERSHRKVKGLTLRRDCGRYAVRRCGFPPRARLAELRRPWRRSRKPRSSPHTRLVTAGRDTQGQHGFVNPAVYHASTVLYPTAEDQVAHRSRYQYGRRGTPTSEALEGALAELEGEKCAGVALMPSGLAAISTALAVGRRQRRPHPGHRQRLPADAQFLRRPVQADGRRDDLLRSADRRGHRASCSSRTPRRCSSRRPARRASRCRTFRRSPRSRTPRARCVLMDNTWATPLYFQRLRQGRRSVDPGRHQIYRRPFRHHVRLRRGQCRATTGAEGDDELRSASASGRTTCISRCAACARWACGWRGISESALRVARWLEQRPEVVRVLHPALPSDPGHAIWKRDFTGACGLFSIVLKPVSQTRPSMPS